MVPLGDSQKPFRKTDAVCQVPASGADLEAELNGARDIISRLARRYPEAMTLAAAGDAEKFVCRLRAGGYLAGEAERAVANHGNESPIEPRRAWFLVRSNSGCFPDSMERLSGEADEVSFVDGLNLLDEIHRSLLGKRDKAPR